MTRTAEVSGVHFPIVSDLYLILLKFRFPPLNMVQEAPNTLTYIPPHSDSMLLFADVVKRLDANEWRFEFTKATLLHEFEEECPESIKVSKELNTPLASVLLPIIRKQEGSMDIFIPTRRPYILKVSIRNDIATLAEFSAHQGPSRQERLWLRKRDDIARLGMINNSYIRLLRMTSNISNRSGGYRAIDVSLKIPVEYLTTEIAFLAGLTNVQALEEELKMIKKTGVGKKRDMGFGDLISWKIYDVKSSEQIRVIEPMIIFYREMNVVKLITLRNIPALFIAGLRERVPLLFIDMKMVLSRSRPPYWIRQELCVAPFSEFLVKQKEYRKRSGGKTTVI